MPLPRRALSSDEGGARLNLAPAPLVTPDEASWRSGPGDWSLPAQPASWRWVSPRPPLNCPPSAPTIARAFRLAERDGHFAVDDVSPEEAAGHITAPTLLLHGTDDIETRPDHSQRVYDALRGPKRLILVPGAHHGGALRADMWTEIESWLDQALGHRPS